MGFEIRGKRLKDTFEQQCDKVYAEPESLHDGFKVTDVKRDSLDETWEPVWVRKATIRNHYNELAVTLEAGSGEQERSRGGDGQSVSGCYDDGLGFRYEFPEQKRLEYFVIK